MELSVLPSRFLSTPSARRATLTGCTTKASILQFLSTPSARRATGGAQAQRAGPRDFYPRPPRGGRLAFARSQVHLCGFLSTPSARRATLGMEFLRILQDISIHALREEGDGRTGPSCAVSRNFYPRPPRGGRPVLFMELLVILHISIHALREEGDYKLDLDTGRIVDFYPRPPRGGRPAQLARASAAEAISIHALREEGDRVVSDSHNLERDFYPRPPRGGRLYVLLSRCMNAQFLSTPSARRATARPGQSRPNNPISIHALREEGDAGSPGSFLG